MPSALKSCAADFVRLTWPFLPTAPLLPDCTTEGTYTAIRTWCRPTRPRIADDVYRQHRSGDQSLDVVVHKAKLDKRLAYAYSSKYTIRVIDWVVMMMLWDQHDSKWESMCSSSCKQHLPTQRLLPAISVYSPCSCTLSIFRHRTHRTSYPSLSLSSCSGRDDASARSPFARMLSATRTTKNGDQVSKSHESKGGCRSISVLPLNALPWVEGCARLKRTSSVEEHDVAHSLEDLRQDQG